MLDDSSAGQYFIMHIKAFLKRISEIPDVTVNPHSNSRRTLNHHSANIIQTHETIYSRSIVTSNTQPCQSALRFINNHNPTLKAKLTTSRQNNEQNKQQIVKLRYRQRIEERLMELMNQRKELVVTRSRSKKESYNPIHCSIQRDKITHRSRQKIPDYVQNMQAISQHRMKPCKIAPMVIGKRPQTSRLEPAKSEPKIYCKPLLASRRRRVSTSNLTRSETALKGAEKTVEQKQFQWIAVGKLDAWNKSKQVQEEDIEFR